MAAVTPQKATNSPASATKTFQKVSILCRDGEAARVPRQLLEMESVDIRQLFSSSTECEPVVVFPGSSKDQARGIVDYLQTGRDKYEHLLPYTAKVYSFVKRSGGQVLPGTYFTITSVTFMPKISRPDITIPSKTSLISVPRKQQRLAQDEIAPKLAISLSEISLDQMEQLVKSNLPFLTRVMEGKEKVERHNVYMRGGAAARCNTPQDLIAAFTDHQLEYIHAILWKKLSVKLHNKNIDGREYLWMVLIPTFLVKLVMDQENIQRDAALCLLYHIAYPNRTHRVILGLEEPLSESCEKNIKKRKRADKSGICLPDAKRTKRSL